MRAAFLMSLVFVTALAVGAVKDPVYDELEGFDLVEALIRDGKHEAALSELKRQPQGDRYWLVMGDLRLAMQDWAAADKACAQAQPSTRQRLCQAQAAAKLKRYGDCARLYAESGDAWLGSQAMVIEKALCEYQAQEPERAMATLNAGYKRYPAFPVDRERVALLLESGSVQYALKHALASLPRRSNGEVLALAEMFHGKKATPEALALIEALRARAPLDLDTQLSAAQLYYSLGFLRATAEAFERAAQVDGKYWYHASEIHRLAGNRQASDRCALLIPGEKERLKARLARYLDGGNYPLLASMLWIFKRSELKDDDEVRYALAYSLFLQGNLDQSLPQIEGITRPEILSKAALLQKKIIDCKANAGLCRI